MKTILFNALGDAGNAGRLDAVLDIARAFEAHVTLLHSVPFEASVVIDPYGATFAALAPVWHDEANRVRDKLIADLANEDVPWNWVETAGPTARALLKESSLQDLIIVGARDPQAIDSGPSFTAGELAVTADCPVLVLPENASRFDVGAPVLVAWDGSAEASHALKAALPFLRKARDVYLAVVKEPTKAEMANDLPPLGGADYLSRHGISSQLVEIDLRENVVAEAIRTAAEIRHAGLIVMGAYGRTRLSERIFGGTTRDMLADVRIPVLLTN